MATEMMMAEDDGSAALLKVCGPLPTAMLSLVREFIGRLQVVADDHAAAVATFKAQADALRTEIATVGVKNAELEATIGALDDRNQALEKEVLSLRDMNGALIAERGALEAVGAAVARYAEQKRHVDALLQAAKADAHRYLVPCAEPNAGAHGGDAVDADAPLDRDAAVPSSAPPVAKSAAAGREACGDASGEIVAPTGRAGGAAGGRRNSESPNISS